MPDKQPHLTIWGRANSVNVQKVLWCLAELDLPYERIDAGMAFGRTREADYLAMNPNARVPTLVEGDFVLWESNSIMRYLCSRMAAQRRSIRKRQNIAPPSSAGSTGRCPLFSRPNVRCSGAWCARRPQSAT